MTAKPDKATAAMDVASQCACISRHCTAMVRSAHALDALDEVTAVHDAVDALFDKAWKAYREGMT